MVSDIKEFKIENFENNLFSSKQLYNDVNRYLDDNLFYNKEDDLWEEVVKLPWAQHISVSNLKLKKIEKQAVS